jgi:hypothetical protein
MTPRARLPTQGASFVPKTKRRPWRSRIYLNGKHMSLGYYASPEAARQAHALAAERYGLRVKAEDRGQHG